MSPSSDPGHIKKHTIGSSNEISFSVLHAMSNSADNTGSSNSSSTPSGSPSTGSFPAINLKKSKPGETITQPKWTYSQQEVNERKSKRKQAKRFAIVTGILIGCAALIIVGFFAVRAVRHQLDFIGQLNEQIDIVLVQEQTLSGFKDSVQAVADKPISELDKTAQQQLKAQQSASIDHVRQVFEGCKSEIERIQGWLVAPADKERSNNAISAINANLNLIEIGENLLDWSLPYEEEYAQAQTFLNKLLEADSLARQAAATSGEPTRETIQASIETSNRAIVCFNEAQAIVVALRDATGLESLQPFVDYTALRIQAQEHALDADQAYLDVNSAGLIAANDAYNACEAQAANLMSEQGGVYPDDLIATRFEEARTANADVESWRSEVARADGYLAIL